MNVLVDQKQVPPRPALQRRHNLHHLISTMFFFLTNIKNASAMLAFAMCLNDRFIVNLSFGATKSAAVKLLTV